jgi:SAM-dependent methyltransferase
VRRRDSFDEVATLYDSARPPYPTDLVDDLIRICGLGETSRVLEIGAGTGHLTVPLAETGAEILAVELGPRMAAIARRRLDPFDRATVEVADFDAWSPEPGTFDLVASATAYHWLDPERRLDRCLAPVRPGGRLAVIHTHWGLRGAGDAFTQSSQACYDAWQGPSSNPWVPPGLDDLPTESELEASSRVDAVHHRRYAVRRTWSAEAYGRLLGSFSNVIGLPPERRAGFLICIESLIRDRFGGTVERLDAYDLWIAEVGR